MGHQDVVDYITEMPDEVVRHMTFQMPWQYDEGTGERKDPDGFPVTAEGKEVGSLDRKSLQTQCWDKFNKNPQVNTAIRGLAGRMCGMGFGFSSEIGAIQEALDETMFDWRNRLYSMWPKYVARAEVEGELFLLLTLHDTGFVEVDFVDPSTIDTGGDDGTGIVFHPTKALLPIFYNIRTNNLIGSSPLMDYEQVPSIYVARYPEFTSAVASHKDVKVTYQKKSKSRKKVFKPFGGYYRFVVGWDKGFMTRRAIGYLRTTLEWLNHYENLKKYEIDHKKSAGAYVWTVQIEDPRTFKLWLGLTDEERRKTGIMAKKTPGSTLVLPPGCTLAATYPQLSKINEEDTDILNLITAGLNEPEDISTGASRAPYASVKASRGPYSDRMADEIAYFERFLKHEFLAGIFYLKSKVTRFASKFKVREATSFDENGEPKFETVSKSPQHLVDISFPTSEVIDYEARAKGLLGTKHGPVGAQIGIPNSEVAKRMGFGGYGRLRLKKATEDEKYPELVYEAGVDAESVQETVEGEPKKKKNAQATTTPKKKKLVKRTTD
jgi:hypothetical protein